MITNKISNISPDVSSVLSFKEETVKKYFYWFCAFWLIIAALEFGQDYIGSLLNGNQFQLFESLSYKTFWLLFIPFSIITGYGLKKAGTIFSGTKYFACNVLLVLAITTIHLITFSFFLFGISSLFRQDPWQLPILITEKFSTRLYITLSVNIILSAVFFLKKRQVSTQVPEPHKYSKAISIKHGKRSVVVQTENIKWINSDGHYITIHTSDKKHVIVESLKNIITSLPANFKRIHRSAIVNIDMISELKSRLNGDYDVILTDGEVLRLSRNYTDALKGILL